LRKARLLQRKAEEELQAKMRGKKVKKKLPKYIIIRKKKNAF